MLPRSRRNPRRSRSCIVDQEGGTGESFKAFIDYLTSSQPVCFFGEMVTSFEKFLGEKDGLEIFKLVDDEDDGCDE